MNSSLRKHILDTLESQPQRIFRAFEIENIINDKVGRSTDSRLVKRTLSSLAAQNEILCTEMNHYKCANAVVNKDFAKGMLFLSPQIAAALRKSGKSFSDEVNVVLMQHCTPVAA